MDTFLCIRIYIGLIVYFILSSESVGFNVRRESQSCIVRLTLNDVRATFCISMQNYEIFEYL